MSKNINVEAHLKRYEKTDLNQVIALIEGLQKLVESGRAKAIEEAEAKLAILKRGDIPAPEAPTRAPRGSKKKEAAAE